jgi:hypothetical protein
LDPLTASLMAIGSGSAAGLRPYFTVLALGIAGLVIPDTAPDMIASAARQIPESITNPWVLAICAVLAIGEAGLLDEGPDLPPGAPGLARKAAGGVEGRRRDEPQGRGDMPMIVAMVVAVAVIMPMIVPPVLHRRRRRAAIGLHDKAHRREGPALHPLGSQAVAAQVDLGELGLQRLQADPTGEQRGDQHVAGRPAEEVEEEHITRHGRPPPCG